MRPHTPVLRRGPDEIQIGLDQEPSLILAGVSAAGPLERLLALLDGCHAASELLVSCRRLGVPGDLWRWTLRTLAAADLLVDAAAGGAANPDSLLGARVRLVGAGTLGRPVAELLLRSGVGVLHLVDTGGPDPSLYPGSTSTTQAEALHRCLEDPCSPEAGGRVMVANHWSKPDAVAPHLTVVASERLECDRVVTEGLVRADQPHLVLRPRAGGVVVGPLVVPGHTACLSCTDLTRRDADPAWPRLLHQLSRTWQPTTPATAGWAAGVAVTQALGFLQGSRPETCGGTIELAPADHLTRWRSWAMHVSCGCGWGSTAQWGP